MKSYFPRRYSAFCGLLLFLSLSGFPAVRGQEPPPPVPGLPAGVVVPPLVSDVDATPLLAAPAPTGGGVPDVAAPPKIERRIYVPFEDLEATMADQGQGVFLPYREFLDMWNQLLAHKEQEKVTPPADGLLASAVFSGKVEGEVAVVGAVLQVESFKDGWAVLPLGGQDLSVARAETGKATLRRGEKGMEALLPEKGKYELKLQIYAQVLRGTGRQSLALSLPKTPVSRLDLAVPGTGWEFSTEPAAAFTSTPSEDGQSSLVSVFFGDHDRMTLSWQKTGGESKLTPLLFADTKSEVTVAPGALSTTVTVDYSILRAGVSEFELAVPQPHEVLAVRGENIKEWNMEEAANGGGARLLKVSLHSPARGHFTLGIDLEAPVGELPASLKVPEIGTRGVLRQSGYVVIRSTGGLDTAVKELNGLTQQASAATAENAAPAATLLGNWRYLKLPWSLSVDAKKAEPVVGVDSFTEFSVQPDSMSFATDFSWMVKRAGIFEVKIRIPPGWDNVEATGPEVEGFSEESTGEAAAAQRFLTVRFKNRQEGTVAVRVTGRQSRASAEAEAAVPVFIPQGVTRHDALVGVRVDGTLDANTRDPGGMKQEDVSRLAQKSPAAAAQAQKSATPWTIGFRCRGEAAPAFLTFKTRKPQVSGEVLALTEIRDQSVLHHWWVQWDILYSGVDTFYLSVPKDIADGIRVETRTLKEVDKSWLPAAGVDAARQYWRIVARDKVPGSFVIELSYETPLGTLESGKNGNVSVPEITLLDLFQETGQIAVIKSGSLEVLAPDKSAALEPVDPRELSPLLRKPGVFLAWKWKTHPATVSLPVSRNELVSVPQAMVTYADLTTVLSTDLALTTEVIYHVRNNTQQYFTVKLPPGGRMLSDVMVAGEPQQPQHRADHDGILVRLPPTQDQKGGFAVRFVYDVPAGDAGSGLGESGKVSIPQPELLDAGILQSQLRLFLPSGFYWQNFDGAMRPNAEERGWSRYRRALGWMVPALGPQLPASTDAGWEAPPTLPDNKRGPFDFQIPRDGQSFLLHRLDRPAAVSVSFRSRRMEHSIEALGVLFGLGLGFLFRRKPAGFKMGYFLFAGIGALVLQSAMAVSAGGFLRYFFAGVMLSVVLWMGCRIRSAIWPEKRPLRAPVPANGPPARGAVESLPESEMKTGSNPDSVSPVSPESPLEAGKPADPAKPQDPPQS